MLIEFLIFAENSSSDILSIIHYKVLLFLKEHMKLRRFRNGMIWVFRAVSPTLDIAVYFRVQVAC